LASKISAVLIELKTDYDFTGREIARRIGIDEAHLSNVGRGNVAGSQQLFAGLLLLLELNRAEKELNGGN